MFSFNKGPKAATWLEGRKRQLRRVRCYIFLRKKELEEEKEMVCRREGPSDKISFRRVRYVCCNHFCLSPSVYFSFCSNLFQMCALGLFVSRGTLWTPTNGDKNLEFHWRVVLNAGPHSIKKHAHQHTHEEALLMSAGYFRFSSLVALYSLTAANS